MLSTLPADLLAAIDSLYAVFAPYPWRKVMDACPHCLVSVSGIEGPLREIPDARMHYYAFKAMTTIGDTSDFKHYLPRMLDLWAQTLTGGVLGLNDEILGSKIAYGHFAEWLDVEQTAILTFSQVLWDTILAHYPARIDVDTFLCTVGNFTAIAPFLARWRETLTTTALAHIADAYLAGIPRSAFWGDHGDQAAILRAWLLEDATYQMLLLAGQEAQSGAFDAMMDEYEIAHVIEMSGAEA